MKKIINEMTDAELLCLTATVLIIPILLVLPLVVGADIFLQYTIYPVAIFLFFTVGIPLIFLAIDLFFIFLVEVDRFSKGVSRKDKP